VRPRVFLRQAQDKLTLRRIIQVRLGTNPAVTRDGCPVAPAHLRGLVTVIHETSGLRELGADSRE